MSIMCANCTIICTSSVSLNLHLKSRVYGLKLDKKCANLVANFTRLSWLHTQTLLLSTELLLVHDYWFSLLDFNFNSNRIQTWVWGWVMQILPNRLKYLQRLNIKGGVKVAGFKGARINMPQATQWIMERVVINVRLAQIRLRTTPWAVEHLKAPHFSPPTPPPTSPPLPNNPQPFSNSPHSPLLWMWEKLKLMFHINSCPAHSALLYQPGRTVQYLNISV